MKIVDKLAWNYVKKIEKEANVSYYTELLNYSLVKGQNLERANVYRNSQEFGSQIIKALIIVIAVIGVSSIIVIFTTYKISYSERIKELGMLSSVGMDKKQKREIAMLKSMGMSNSQMNKMFFLEGIFYGLDSLIYGSVNTLCDIYY